MLSRWFVLAVVIASIRATCAQAAPPDFERDVLPIFRRSCYECHGPKEQISSFRLDVRDVALRGGDSGERTIVPHNAAESLLYQYVSSEDADTRMPPADSDVPALTDAEIATLRAWIDAGPAWPDALAGSTDDGRRDHWAWKPIKKPSVPDEDATNPIDRFLLAKSPHGFAPPTDPRTLIRRLTYDLTGLPPSPTEVDAFANDHSPQAYDALVARLLDSPQYGERWGRKWLDVVRYADTAGDTADFPVMEAWRYRNWVIGAFNADMPFDQFLKAQLAGDVLARSDEAHAAELITATGYWAIARRFGADGDKDMYLTYDDAIDNLGKSMLGLSIACARCHDHKYDPISARDYYGIYGMLSSTRFAFPGTELRATPRDLVSIVSREDQQRLANWSATIAPLEKQVAERQAEHLAHARQADAAAAIAARLAGGDIGPTGAAEFALETDQAVALKAGEMLQLAIDMRGNNGGDATAVEWVIEEQGGPQRMWNAARDITPHLLPQTDKRQMSSEGIAGVWFLYDLEPGAALLAQYDPALFGVEGAPVWRRGDFPLAMVNTRDTEIKLQTISAPPHVFALHPGARAGVALAWRAPVDGTFTVRGRVAKIDPGGDGVAWRLEKRGDLQPHFAKEQELLAHYNTALAERNQRNAERPVEKFAYAVQEAETIANARLHRRGDPENLGDEVPRKNLDLFGGQVVEQGSGRRELADWIASSQHPLTARVMVNRIWQGHFGRGIVATPNDFGTRGQPPSHPELLDWLAVTFVEQGWSIKAMHRLMVTSQAYQQQCSVADSAWKLPRRRLDAEEIRDSLLVAAGELDLTPGEGHPFTIKSGYRYSQHVPFRERFDTKQRSVYLLTLRLVRDPMLGLFDSADANSSTPQRAISTVPTQALYFLNDAAFQATAAALAQRAAASENDDERVQFIYRTAYQRAATDKELARSLKFVAAVLDVSGDLPEAQRDAAAWGALCRVVLGANEFLYLD